MADLRQNKVAELENALATLEPKLKPVLPGYLPLERFVSLARSLARNQDVLLNCSIESIKDCIWQAAEKGLEIGGPNKHSAVIRFKNTAVLIIQWQGRAFLWTRSGAITKLTANVIYKGDYYKVRLGDEDTIEHHPDVETDRSPAFLNNIDNIVGAYAIATLPNGDRKHSFVSRSELVRLRDWVKKKNEGRLGFGWQDWLPEMCKKTAVHRLDGFIQPPSEMTEMQAQAWERAQRTVEVEGVLVEDDELTEDEMPRAKGSAQPEGQSRAHGRSQAGEAVASPGAQSEHGGMGDAGGLNPPGARPRAGSSPAAPTHTGGEGGGRLNTVLESIEEVEEAQMDSANPRDDDDDNRLVNDEEIAILKGRCAAVSPGRLGKALAAHGVDTYSELRVGQVATFLAAATGAK